MKQFHEMPNHARIWIYHSENPISLQAQEMIQKAAQEFIDEWTSHGQKMDASFGIFHDRFLILAVDEAQAAASGCGIDKSVRFFQDLGKAMGTDLFQRMKMVFEKDGSLHTEALHQFWAMRKAGIINGQTKVFDNTIKTVGELNSKWLVPFEESWHQEMWAR